MYETMNQEKMDAFAQLTMLRSAIADIAPADDELAVINSLMEKLQSRQYTVAVVGEFNRGKSSLINALLGMSVLPADITPTTATINRVVYSAEPYAKLYRTDGQVEEIPMGMLESRVTKLTKESQSAAAQIKEAVIGYPTVFCRNNVSILDTPGLNESPEMDQLTFECVQQADALIYMIHALVPLSMSEAQAVCRLLEQPNICHVLFTVGFMDQIPLEERQRVLSSIQKRIIKCTDQYLEEDDSLSDQERQRRKEIIQSAAVLGVSAKQALDAFVSGSMEQLETSGMEEYKKALMSRLTAQQDEWVELEIRPYLEKDSVKFDEAAQRTLTNLNDRIQSAQGNSAEAARLLIDLRNAMRPTGTLELHAMNALGDGQNEQKLLQIIMEARQKQGVAVQKASTPAAEFGVTGWLRRKAKEMDLYRERTDPVIQQIKQGFAEAKEEIIQVWKPQINYAFYPKYADYRGKIDEKCKKIGNHIQTAFHALTLKPGRPLEMRINWIDDEELLRNADLEELYRLDAGALNVGTEEYLMNQLAKSLMKALQMAIRKREASLKNDAVKKVCDLSDKGTKWIQEMQPQLEALCQEREKLQKQIESIRRFLFGAEDGAEPKSKEKSEQTNE